ncbi:MAG: DUF4352 domain-containing protein [Bryobacteraceae bacterium]
MEGLRVLAAGVFVACVVATSGCAPAVAPVPKEHRMGERVNAGSLQYNVFDGQWRAQLGEGHEARVPKDRFFIIRLSVANSASADLMIPALTLVDDNGQTYPELSDGSQVPSWMGFLRKAHPAENLQGTVVFDVPPRHYRLRVADENDQKSEEIDIPLSFADTPEIPPQATQQ